MAEERVELKISSLAFGGEGLARYSEGQAQAGKVVFVRGGLPGERVEARIINRRRDFDRAEAVRIIEASPERVRPSCPLFGVCGGCQLQHLAYSAQLAIKAGWLKEALGRAGVSEGCFQRLQASPGQWRYRYRARLAVTASGKLGFRASGSLDVVPLKACPIMTRELETLVARLSQLLADRPPGVELEVQSAADKSGQAFVLFSAGGKPIPGQTQRLLENLEEPLAAAVYTSPPTLKELPAAPPPGSLALTFAGYSLHLFPGVFAQAQLPQNRALVKAVLDLVQPRPGQRILDLMAGMGNFSLPLALAGARVKAVEISRLACANGRYNAALAGLEIEFEANPAVAVLRKAAEAKERYDAVIADPPRQGLKELIEPLSHLEVPRLVYVSCDPMSLARDLKKLTGLGFRVERVVPLDLFPQTYHLESACLLVH